MNLVDISISIDEINFAVHSRRLSSNSLIKSGRLVIPKSLNTGEKLSFIRNTLSFMIQDYNIKFAKLNLIENDLDIITIIKIEAVMEELLSSRGVDICN